MIGKLLFHCLAATIGLFVAIRVFHFGSYNNTWQVILWAGVIIGLAHFFVRPILRTIALPLRIVTLGIFSFVIDMFLLWMALNLFFQKEEIAITGLKNIFLTAITIWFLGLIFGLKKTK